MAHHHAAQGAGRRPRGCRGAFPEVRALHARQDSLEVRQAALEAIGMEAIGMEAIGMEAIGMEAIGMEAIGMEAIGMEAIGMEAI
ncbi:MAG: hypothetical protein LBQ79_09490, partial [Deltaproteobacteria bacterium]|nr:hypothetical protein [Deltaproteobacteria bacterium]